MVKKAWQVGESCWGGLFKCSLKEQPSSLFTGLFTHVVLHISFSQICHGDINGRGITTCHMKTCMQKVQDRQHAKEGTVPPLLPSLTSHTGIHLPALDCPLLPPSSLSCSSTLLQGYYPLYGTNHSFWFILYMPTMPACQPPCPMPVPCELDNSPAPSCTVCASHTFPIPWRKETLPVFPHYTIPLGSYTCTMPV